MAKSGPHITVDLYQGIDLLLLLEKTDQLAKTMQSFNVSFFRLNNFHRRVLYLEPRETESFLKVKKEADKLLGDYQIAANKGREYNPHLTVLINERIEEAIRLLTAEFRVVRDSICHLALYKRNMELVKLYNL